ncbi:peptidoglycan DD-metalloendopeptidase family protein [Microbacterium sp. T2.11-28]|uniref:peptidoglycan DD-metalloendopeptidase family protein n=1 Tax=Microbacterium sp. T2.11-28 TaxID=3041169 RepID=UPI00247747D7|nr:M23 family metallopeptidase [Microbacterium sp. T2.11-28]CAI9394178.1 hypothetical protein MICABA_02700 [Microbacterium sp. T2.11-28]
MERHTLNHEQGPEVCGCAPSRRELAAFSRGRTVTRRSAIGFGVVGLAAAGLIASGPAFAATYPSWDDVEKAKASLAAKSREVTRIEGLIASLANDVALKQAEAERLSAEYIAAQEAFEEAADRTVSLQGQADSERARAAEAADKLGRLAAQHYRLGGNDTTLELFFSGSAANADDLLARLGTMDKLVEANRSVYTDAVSARDNAQNLSNQAAVARAERDRLQQQTEAKMLRAQDAAQNAQSALDAQDARREVLEAQLAALRDTTTKTVSRYRAGVEARRKARKERLRREREEAERRAREEQSSGSEPGDVAASGWTRPAYGGVSRHFGARGTICANGYCTSSGHRGTDMYAGCGAPIFAAASGRVVFAAYNGAWGNFVKIDHGGGIASAYAHIKPSGFAVRYGEAVRAGQVVAYAGNTGVSTGCHVHFEIYTGATRINPVPFMRARGVHL